MRTFAFVILKAFVALLLVLEAFDFNFRMIYLAPSKASEWEIMSLFFVDIYNHRQRLKSRENLEDILTQLLHFYKAATRNYAIALFMFSHSIVSSRRWGTDQFIVLTVSTPDAPKLGLLNKWMKLNIKMTTLSYDCLVSLCEIWPKNTIFWLQKYAFSRMKTYTCGLNVYKY